jgi:hypothetical protein
LHADVQLEVINMAIEPLGRFLLTKTVSGHMEKEDNKTHRNIADTAPLLKALKLLQAHKLAELIERTHAPVAGLLNTHDFDGLEDSGDTAWAKAARGGSCGFMQDFCEFVGLERAV